MALDKNAAICADTVFVDGVLVAEDVNITLPSVTHQTTTILAGGEIEVPITGWTDPMELSITKIGVDKGLINMLRQQSMTIECRFVEDYFSPDGTKTFKGYKAFMRCTPKGIPELTLELGSNPENAITYAVTRYEVMIDNTRAWCIDKINNIYEVGGVDYAKNVRALL